MTITDEDINYEIMKKAFSFLGVAEVKGKESNQQIINMFKSAGFSGLDDEVPWCAAYVTHVLKECHYDYLKTLRARDYHQYGAVAGNPKLGNIVALWRESEDGWKGHVGFLLHMDVDMVWILGGNQSNQVTTKIYHRSRVLSFRQAVLPA